MRFAYLLLAHDAFDQLARLVDRLLADGPDDRVFLHIDAKTPLPAGFAASLPPRAELIAPRVAVYWGHHSQCDATRALLAAALPGGFDFHHLLSGRDWPLVPRAAIAAAIATAGARDCFVAVEDDRQRERMDAFCLADRRQGPQAQATALSWRYVRAMRAASHALSRWRGPRPQPLGPWRRGSQWWSLPRDAAAHAAAALEGLATTKRLRFTRCSDEHVVQTALANSRFAARIADGNRRHIPWPAGAASPSVLKCGDVAAGDAWFARKFDAKADDFFYDL